MLLFEAIQKIQWLTYNMNSINAYPLLSFLAGHLRSHLHTFQARQSSCRQSFYFFFNIGVQHLIEAHLIVMVVNPLFCVSWSLFKVTLCHGSTMSACPPCLLKPSSTIMTPVGLWIFIGCSLTTASLHLLNMTPGASPTLILLLLAIIHIHST
jgi:hypothetical protein